jgi:hypothetical protein
MFAPPWATEWMRGGDVMDNIGEMPRRTEVNGVWPSGKTGLFEIRLQ